VRELETDAEKKENKKREKQEKEEKKEDQEKEEIPETTGRNLEDAKAAEDKKTIDAKKTDDKNSDEDSKSTYEKKMKKNEKDEKHGKDEKDEKEGKDSETAGKRRLILRPAAADAPVDDSASSSEYVKKYALGTRNRVLTSVGDTSEGVGSMISNLEKKLLETLEMVPIALARSAKGQTEFAFPEGFSAKIGQKKTGYNLAGLNSDSESSNLDFARIH
jgi:hypothetical protein